MTTDCDLSFARIYCVLSTLLHALLALTAVFVLELRPNSLGPTLTSPWLPATLLGLEVAKVALAKRLSGHSKVFSLPQYTNPVRGDLTKGPWLRRTVLRVKKLVFRLKPVRDLANGILLLAAAFVLIAYVTVCFGAPVFSRHNETTAFAVLLTLLAALPALLVYGPDQAALQRVAFQSGLKDVDPLAHMLFQNGFGAVVGAWLGAFPIPLDWDRPWQAWPITCCVGAMAGAVLAGGWSLVQMQSIHSRSATYAKLRKKI